MSFLNFILVFGAAAAVLPVLIHLLSRSRHRVVPWAAMHLLEPAIRQTRRRIRVEQLLLMLIRAAILGLLAFCMARPVLTGWRALSGDSPTSTVVLLDDSYSMEAGTTDATTNFVHARAAVSKILESLRPGSEISLFTIGGRARPVGAEIQFDPANLGEALQKIQPGFSAVDTPAALTAAATTLGRMRLARRDLILISDFQRGNWPDAQAAAREQAYHLFDQLPVKPNVIFFRAGPASIENVAVESLDVSPPVVGAGQTIKVRSAIHNYGDTPRPDLHIYFRVDGQERSQTRITLGPGQRGQVLFSHTFPAGTASVGSHVVEIFTDADRLKADNSCLAAVNVIDHISVLLVNGAPSQQPLRGETDFLQLALQPMDQTGNRAADLLQPKVIETRNLNAQALAGVGVVVLANVTQLSETQTRALTSFVHDGGGLLIFPGDHINPTWYNTTLGADGAGLLPAKLGSVIGDHVKPTAIVSQHFTHPAMELFNDPRNGNLGEAEIRHWWQLEVPSLGSRVAGEDSAETRNTKPETVLAHLDTGDPFLVEKESGHGVVIVAATACDADWSDLPLRTFYLPLMQQLTVHAASHAIPPRDLAIGDPLVAIFPATESGKEFTLTTPDGVTHRIVIANQESHGLAEFHDTQRPGLYTLTPPAMENSGSGSVIHFVVNATRAESDLHQLTDAELQKTADRVGGAVIHDWSEYARLDQTRRYGREIWRPLFWAVVGLIFAELLLQQWITRKKP